MTDLDNDPVAAAFDHFRGQVAPLVRPAGAARTRETVRTRKRNRTVVLGVLATLVVAIPAGIAAIPHGPDVSARVITVAELNRAKLEVPAWPAAATKKNCPHGLVQFAPPAGPSWQSTDNIGTVIYADVNHDGRKEAVAEVYCRTPTYFAQTQIVAFYRDRTGAIRTLGQVIVPGGTVDGICGLRNGPGGTVQVQVHDFPAPLGCWPLSPGQKYPRFVTLQWRTYAWTGKGFAQRGGPTSFPPNPYLADLAISASNLTLVRQPDGHYRGSMTVTVRNLSTGTIPYRTMTFVTSDMKASASSGFTAVDDPYGGGMKAIRTTGAPIPGGATQTVTLSFDSPRRVAAFTFDPGSNLVIPGNYGDPNSSNDQVRFKILFQG